MEPDLGADIGAMSKELKSFTTAVKTQVEKLEETSLESKARLLSIEQKLSAPTGGIGDPMATVPTLAE